MAGSMKLIAKKCFPNAIQVIDRLHVQKLAIEAVQELRIHHRWEAIELENEILKQAKYKKLKPEIEVFENGDTKKQLLARSLYMLYTGICSTPVYALQKQGKVGCFAENKSRDFI